MSSEREVRILSAESLRIPEEGSSAQGKSGPKPRQKCVGDGERVEIPVPPVHRLSDGVTQGGRSSHCWKSVSKRVGSGVGKSALLEPETRWGAKLK